MKIDLIPVAKINAAPYNPRKDLKPGDRDYESLVKSIEKFGYIDPIVWNRRTGNLVGGHQRFKILTARGATHVECSVVDFDDATEKAANIALNKISGDWEIPKLKELLVDLDSMDFDISFTGFTEAELKNLIDWDGKHGEKDADAVPAAPIQAKTKLGDIYLLGDHRLICGDSTDASTVSMLMRGKKADLMVTDPPYGVEYDADWRNDDLQAGGMNGAPGGRAVGKVLNDGNADWRAAWSLFSGNIAYVWHAGVMCGEVAQSLQSCDFVIRSQIIWAKSHLAISRGHYHYQHEPCFYAVRKTASGNWQGDRKQTTLWQIDKPSKSETGHSTQKPIECMQRPMMNHTKAGDIIYDPFLGSGTTLIAAEKIGRVCYGVELNPVYCDVIVQRWEEFTGKKAVLENGKQEKRSD